MRISDLLALFQRSPVPVVSTGKVQDALLKDRTVFLGSVIDDAAANDVIARLLFLERESAREPINLWINSPGGLVMAGLAIMDTMDALNAPVTTHCLGTAHSMAAVLLASGRKGFRSAGTQSTIMFTLPTALDDGDAQKQKDAVRFGEILIAKTAMVTKRPAHEIRKFFESGVELSAQDAVVFGIIDGIIDPAK